MYLKFQLNLWLLLKLNFENSLSKVRICKSLFACRDDEQVKLRVKVQQDKKTFPKIPMEKRKLGQHFLK